jgi:molybdopterin molybdotransferase
MDLSMRRLTAVDDVLRLIEDRVHPLDGEAISLGEAAGRVLAADVVAPVDVPHFDRSAMDGYALRGRETADADRERSLEFTIIGDSLPGRPFVGHVASGQAVRIMTGAPLPEGTDAVVELESALQAGATASLVRVMKAVPPGRNVGKRGEDIEKGTVVLQASRVLRPQDVGVLASIGASPIEVARRPSVAIVVTGDVARNSLNRHSNALMLAALLDRDGVADARTVVMEESDDLAREATEDVIVVLQDSRGGRENLFDLLREPGEISVDGMALWPAANVVLGFLGSRPVCRLPDNAECCLCAYDLLVGPLIRRLGGRASALPYSSRAFSVGQEICSAKGRLDYVRVRIEQKHVHRVSLRSGSGVSDLSSTTQADGFILIAPEIERLTPGERVTVYLYGFFDSTSHACAYPRNPRGTCRTQSAQTHESLEVRQ